MENKFAWRYLCGANARASGHQSFVQDLDLSASPLRPCSLRCEGEPRMGRRLRVLELEPPQAPREPAWGFSISDFRAFLLVRRGNDGARGRDEPQPLSVWGEGFRGACPSGERTKIRPARCDRMVSSG